MAPREDAPPSAASGRIERRSRRRRVATAVLVVLASVLVLAAAALAWLGSESALVTVVERAVGASGGRIAVESPSGTLTGVARAARIVWHDGPTTVSIDDATLGIDARALLRGRLRLRDVSAARIEVVGEPSDAPPAMPTSLAPPIGVEVVGARIGELVLHETGTDATTRIANLQATLRYAGGAWTIDSLSLRGPFGALQASGTVRGAPPFAVAARALLETRALDEAVTVDATAGGTLAALEVDARTALRDATVSAKARLAPFSARPLVGIDATFGNVDASRFAAGAPATRLSGRLVAQAPGVGGQGGQGGQAAQSGQASQGGQAGQSAPPRAVPPPATGPTSSLPPLAGTLALRNERAGPLDAGLLPVATLDTRFAFDGERLRLDALALDGPPGRVAGEASLRLPAGALPAAGTLPDFTLALRTDGLDLRRAHAALRETALRGEARISPEGGGLRFDAQLADGELALDARARLADALLTIEAARLAARDGVAEFAGTAGIAEPYRFALAGTLAKLDPSRFVDVPAGLLNGSWRAAGAFGASPAVDASAKLVDSRWRGQPLAGAVAARWEPDRIRQVDAALRLGATSVTARGDLGALGDRLAIAVDAPRLRELDAMLGGAATLDTELRDALLAPAVSASLRAQDLRVGDRATARAVRARIEVVRPQALVDVLERLGVATGAAAKAAPLPRAASTGVARGGAAGKGGARSGASAKGPAPRAAAVPPRPGPTRAAPSPSGPPIDVALDVDGLVVDGTAVDTVRTTLSGDADRHQLAVRAAIAARGVDAALRAEGALDRDRAASWRGRVVEATNAASPRLRLLAPTDVAAAPDAASIGPLDVEIDGADGARLKIDAASWQDGRVRLLGALSRVPLRWVGALAEGRGLRPNEPDALRMGARIDVAGTLGAGGDLRGRVEAFRESGDLVVDVPAAGGGVEPLRAGLQALDARVEVGDGRIAATVAMRGAAIGTLRADARAPLAWTPAGALDTSVPLEGTVDLSLPSLAFTRALAGDAWRFDGALQARLAIAGTLAAPVATGRIEGTRLAAEQRELGMRLSDGTLAATLRDNAIDIETLRFSSGAGSVSMTGSLRPDERSEAVLTLDRMPIPLGAGQRLVLSGEARATLRGGVLAIRGALRADEGVIELTTDNAPSVSRDVVVVRNAAEAAARADAKRAAQGTDRAEAAEPDADAGGGFRILSDLQIDLGERFRVFGSGVEARLEGQLTLRGRLPDAPRLTGTVRIAQGTYAGFGQKLEIERGTLVFSGPIDNPAIDIVAYRRYLPVEAGVALTGTARTPRLALVSKPDVPEPDKLSWLVLGTGSDTARSGGQSTALQAAAATLLASRDPRASGTGIASTFGLDVLSVRTGQVGGSGEAGSSTTSAQDSIVTLGKRLSQRLFVSYEQSLRGLQNLLRLQYEITERLSVRSRIGTQNAVDLLWTYRYD